MNVIQIIHNTNDSMVVSVMNDIFSQMSKEELDSFAVTYWGKRWKDIGSGKFFASTKSSLVWDSFILCYHNKC